MYILILMRTSVCRNYAKDRTSVMSHFSYSGTQVPLEANKVILCEWRLFPDRENISFWPMLENLKPSSCGVCHVLLPSLLHIEFYVLISLGGGVEGTLSN